MKILYIWDGLREPLPKDREECISATRAIYPNAKYACITKLNFFLEGFEVISWDDVLHQMVKDFNLSEVPRSWNRFMEFSDWARFWYLANNPNTMYSDTDCQMLKYFDFEKQIKFIYPKKEIFLLYSPQSGMGKNSMELLKYTLSKNITGLLLPIYTRLDKVPWATKIPDEYVSHKGR